MRCFFPPFDRSGTLSKRREALVVTLQRGQWPPKAVIGEEASVIVEEPLKPGPPGRTLWDPWRSSRAQVSISQHLGCRSWRNLLPPLKDKGEIEEGATEIFGWLLPFMGNWWHPGNSHPSRVADPESCSRNAFNL